MSFRVIPAIDLHAGRVVRLRQGDFAHQTLFDHDPVALAQRYAAAGAQWLHVVDLDGARTGRFENLGAIAAITRIDGLRIQAGGGVRSTAALRQLFDAGVERAVIGSIAIRQPEITIRWMQEFGADRIVLALDVRPDAGGLRLPVNGWTEDPGVSMDVLTAQYVQAGARHLLCTDIARDGTMEGFNLPLYHDLHQSMPGLQILASGGSRSLDDIRAVRSTGVAGVILGRALLEGGVSIEDALKC